VLAQSGAANLTLVGFSQGTAQGFACMSSNPKLAAKLVFTQQNNCLVNLPTFFYRVNLFIALAPVSEVRGFSNPVVGIVFPLKFVVWHMYVFPMLTLL